jgi:peptidylprolyl isomerase
MVSQKGDFVLLEYVARVKETNEVFDTTKEDVAKKEHLYKEGDIYEPKLVVIGENWVLKTLDESLITMEIGKAATTEISPDKAFGTRDPEKIKRVPLKQLIAKEINPTLGARVEYNGKMATVRTVGAGRVLLDFNPPLAGKTLVYEATIQRKLEKDEEKIGALIHRRIPLLEESKLKLGIKEKSVNIDMPEEAFYLEGVQVAKRGIAMDIQKFYPEITAVKFSETFKAEPKSPEPKKEKTVESKKEQPAEVTAPAATG